MFTKRLKAFIKLHPIAMTSVMAGAALFFGAHLLDWDVFEWFVAWVQRHEEWELDELILPIVVIAIGVIADQFWVAHSRRLVLAKLAGHNEASKVMVEESERHFERLMRVRKMLKEEVDDDNRALLQLDRLIIKAFHDYERAQRRADVPSDMGELLFADGSNLPPVEPAPATVNSKPKPL